MGHINSGETSGLIVAQSGAPIVSGVADVNEHALVVIPIAANSLGANGLIEVCSYWSCVNSVNVKTARVRYGAIGDLNGTIYMATALTNLASAMLIANWFNAGAANAQAAENAGGTYGTSVGVAVTSAINTLKDSFIAITAQKATAAEQLTLLFFQVLLYPFN
jgi:hypothetical protein